jgi:multiple sugar transport system permease protein
VFVLAVTAVVLYPALWMLMSSFKPTSEIVGNVSLWPESASMANYATALQGIGGVSFWTFFWNSMFLAVMSVIGIALSSSISSYAFARIDFPGRRVFFALMIATLLLPFHVVIIPQYIVFNNLGLVDSFVPLLIGKFLAAEAFFVFLMVQFMRNLPRELDEAARIDGAGHVRIFTAIMLPLMKPALVTSSIFAFIWSWNDFFGPLLYLKDPALYSLPIALRLFVDQTSTSDYGAQMAMSVLALIPVMLFFLLFQRYLVGGVATQGLKG